MIRLEDLYSFIEGNFDYLLVVDRDEKIVHASQLLRRACAPEELMLQGERLEDVVTEPSLASFRQAMAGAGEGRRGTAVFTPSAAGASSVPLKAEYAQAARGAVYLFFGTHLDGIGRVSEWEKNERIKELSCLYAVAEWLRVAESMEAFFRKLPDVIGPGMQFPEKTVVCSQYLGATYGRPPPSKDQMATRLVVNRQDVGQIRVGYVDDVHGLLPEEQKMLNQIGRMVSLTLEQKTYEQQIQQADKMASLGQLVSGIGHEINNPNQFIRGNIKIVRQAFEDLLPILDEYHGAHPDLKVARLKYAFFREHIMTLVDDMAHGSERIKRIVDALRGFVRQDDGLLVDKVEINTLIAATVRLVESEVHKRAVVCLDLGENVPTFTGNSQKIEQVLVNLIVNASQAVEGDAKGRITVRTRGEGREVVIEVADNGRGMPEQTLKKIFDPFFTTKRAKGGTGLGLAISHRIVTEHGGTIAVASEPGKGTVFTIRIPVIRGAPKTS